MSRSTCRLLRAGCLDAIFTGTPEPVRLRGLENRVVWVTPQDILLLVIPSAEVPWIAETATRRWTRPHRRN